MKAIKTKENVMITAGTILMITCIIILGSFDLIFTGLLHKMLILSPEGKMFKNFDSPGLPIYMDFYIFNVTNSEEIQHYGAKPKLVELGPYSYIIELQKKDYNWNDTEGYVEYRQKKNYFFDHERSKGKLSDQITTLNPIMVVLGSRIHEQDSVLKAAIELFFLRFNLNENLFIKKNVSELLFEGYYDPLVEMLGKITDNPIMREGKFGYYYEKNGTDDGLYKVKTGVMGMEDYLSIQEWEHREILDYWGDPYCNMINGSDGTQYPPGIKKEVPLAFFSTDLCRSVLIEYEKDVALHDISLFRFILPQSSVESSAETKCFCDDKFACRSTLVNIHSCKPGAPIMFSPPHFYQGDPEEVKKLDGLNPRKDLHQAYLDVEPITGVVLEGAKRIQLNLPLKRYGSSPSFKNVPELLFPVMWASENAQIPEDSARSLKMLITLPYFLVYFLTGIIVIIGVILIITGFTRQKRIGKTKGEILLVKE